MIGRVFGRLTIVAQVESSSQGRRWRCRCTCGAERVHTTSSLNRGDAISCGCARTERIGALHRLAGDVAGKNRLLASYLASARRRGLAFDLTPDQFFTLVKGACVYCGTPPSTSTMAIAPSGQEPFVYNGIDRVNNTLGYVIDNCVPCCGWCNKAKNVQPQAAFIAYLDRVAAFRSK